MSYDVRLANEAWEALYRAQATLLREFTENPSLAGSLQVNEYGVLYALAGSPHGLRVTELNQDVLLSAAGMSRLVLRLERRGLIERTDDPDDGRAYRLRLTPTGSELQRSVGSVHARHVADAMSRALNTEQLAVLRDMCQELIRSDPDGPTSATGEGPSSEIGTVHVVIISAGVSQPSTTRMLADTIARKTVEQLAKARRRTALNVVELGPLATDIAQQMVSGLPSERLQAAIATVAAADAVIAVAPVYKAGISGLFKSFIDVLDNDLLVARPVVLAATAGSARHALVPDEQMRPLFAFMRALPVPTSVFATTEDWSSPELGARAGRAATELVQFLLSGVGASIADATWADHDHQFAGNAERSTRNAAEVDFSTDLMALATGGHGVIKDTSPADPTDPLGSPGERS